MVISDSLPIQFWLESEPTYNETLNGSIIDTVTFYKEYKHDDLVKLQFPAETGGSYILEFYSCEDVLINSIPFTEVVEGFYGVQFYPESVAGILDVGRVRLRIVQSVIIDTIITETQISIDEFTVDMDDWENFDPSDPSPPTIQSLDDYQQTGPSTYLVLWDPQTSGPMIDKPFYKFQAATGFSKVAYIELNGLNAYEYDIHAEIDVSANILTSINFDSVFYFLDASFAVLGSVTFNEPAFTPGVKQVDFTVPSGIGNVKYIGLRIYDNSAHVFFPPTLNVFTWFVADIVPIVIAQWVQSADNSGSLKLTTLATDKPTVLTKLETLPQEAHFIRVKFDTTYPPTNTGLSLVFNVLDGVTILSSNSIPVATDGTEQTFILPITTSSIWANADALQFILTDADDTFLATDVIHINSVEFYTESIEYIGAFVRVFKSDHIYFNTEVEESVLIRYKTTKNFNLISPVDDEDYYSYRIEGVFYPFVIKTESKDVELSNGIVINTASQLQRYKKLVIPDIPEYEQVKLQTILQFAISGILLINGVEWTVEDTYANVGDRPLSWPWAAGEVLLRRKNYSTRNVI